MEVRAKGKYLKISPKKAKLIADLIRGKKVNDAIEILRYTPKNGARLFLKVLKSAVANAEQKKVIDIDNLFVKQATAEKSFMLKRVMPKAMGRADIFKRKYSHLTVVLEER
ncbi:MAG: 50S ribosomal protein L22 [Proteobacteria bacterium]|nr:50S ribosomal protein L22 [Pseudomonadota bacterium]